MKLTHLLSASALIVAATLGATQAEAREQIRIVGSSTVFPFTTAVAERFGQNSGNPTPVVESTGTGGGMKLFCAGVGVEHPDFTNASRAIKSSEAEMCNENGVQVHELKVGFDGIVLGSAQGGITLDVTREQIFRALAAKLPSEGGELVDNPNKNWSDIDPSLPNEPIVVLGPPPTSGTRDAFVELVMEVGCEEVGGMEGDDCKTIREDGVFVEAGENDNLIVQKLVESPQSVGVFGFSFLDQNSDKLHGATVGGIEPTFENIASGEYPVSRSLFVYAKINHVGVIPGMKEFIEEYVSEDAFGSSGYLADKGLIPLPDEARETERNEAVELKPLSM